MQTKYALETTEYALPDPGNAGVLPHTSIGCVALKTAGAETRTLPNPVKAGLWLLLSMKEYVGNCVVTTASAYDETGGTTLTFSEIGQFVLLFSVETAPGVYGWRVIGYDGVTGPTIKLSAANLTTLSIGGTAVTATASEINQHCDESANTEVVATTNVIGAAESGKTFYLSLAAGFTSTLPAPAAGLKFRFIVKTAPTGAAYVITTNGGDNILYGHMVERAGGAGVAGAARDTFNFIHNQSIIGDWVEFYSDGTNWYYHGMVDVAAGNTVSAT